MLTELFFTEEAATLYQPWKTLKSPNPTKTLLRP